MTRRQIDAARERRLWFTQVIMPLLMGGGYIMWKEPKAREVVVTKFNNVKRWFTDRFKK